MKNPKNHLEADDKVIIIADGYPKARHHYLVLPRENIKSLKEVTTEHLDLLKHMDKIGREFAERVAPKANFRYGYHAAPSMSHLHLHVVSQDFCSPCLKHKKHWNSFTTKFFIDSEDIIKNLEEKGKLELISRSEAESLLKLPLRCHICKETFSLFPRLKEHVQHHENEHKE